VLEFDDCVCKWVKNGWILESNIVPLVNLATFARYEAARLSSQHDWDIFNIIN
jgi:hypothetical protein